MNIGDGDLSWCDLDEVLKRGWSMGSGLLLQGDCQRVRFPPLPPKKCPSSPIGRRRQT